MKTYTYTEARQRLAALLDIARREGRVQIRRRDGQIFVLQPVTPKGSPLHVPGVRISLKSGESLEWLVESRERSTDRLFPTSAANKRARPERTRHKASGKSRRQSKARTRG